MVKLIIYGNPVTKKNSNRIVSTKNGRKRIIPSKAYIDYEKMFCSQIHKEFKLMIDYPVNVKSVYYRATRHKVDLNNLHSALHDCLVKAGVLEDDNYKIIASTDGSRVEIDKENPRVEIEICKK